MRFFIQNGVRRALASLRAGRKTIPAILYRQGKRPESRPRLRLALLYSAKLTMDRDARFLRIEPPINEPIEVEFLGLSGQPRAIPLAKVRLR